MIDKINKLIEDFRKPSFPAKNRVALYERLISLMKGGLSPVQSIERTIKAMSARGMERNESFKIMSMIHKDMVSGRHNVSLAHAIKPYCSDAEYMLINSSEVHGRLEHGLKESIYLMDASEKMKAAVVSSLSYPAIISFVLIVALWFFNDQLIPTAISISSPETWSGASQWMYWETTVLLPVLIWGVGFMVLFSIAMTKVMPNWVSPSREPIDKYFPVFILYRNISGAGFLISLSAILQTGASQSEALNNIIKSTNPYLFSKIKMIINRMADGYGTGSAMDVGLFDKETSVSIDIFSEDADFDEKLQKISHDSVDNVVSLIKSVGQMAFYGALMVVGMAVGVLVIGFFSLTASIT